MTSLRHGHEFVRYPLCGIALGGWLLLGAAPSFSEEGPALESSTPGETQDAAAEESSGPMFDLRGYGTLGVVHSSEDRADYLAGTIIRDGAGYSANWSPEVDSRLGAQLTATFSPRFSAVLQVVAEQGPDGSYEPQVEWANLKYQVTPDFSVRVGRVVIASFLVADSRKVGYANPWVRPPVELYAMVPVTSSDGIDASYRLQAGSFTHTFLANYGETEKDLADGTEVRANSFHALSLTSERGAMTLRAALSTASLTVERINSLTDAFRQFGPEGIALADRYEVDGSRSDFASFGAEYDPGRWFALAEWGTTHSDTALGGRRAWYVSAGYRLAAFTPYLTLASSRPDTQTSDPGLTVGAYPPELTGVILGLNGALNGVLAGNPVQDTLSAGLRWDFHANFDLKLQLDHSRLGPGSAGSLGNLQPGFERGGSYNLVSLAVDFVF